MSAGRRLLVILGNQLFEPRHLGSPADTVVFLAEDGWCTSAPTRMPSPPAT
jgi:hypothetical protein